MKRLSLFILLLLSCAEFLSAQTILFDDDWLFHRGAAQGAEDPIYSDVHWTKLDLPHDWSIENLPGKNTPFDSTAISQVSGGFTVGGTGWYRKHFTVPASDSGQRFYLRFDGVYMNADCWINGKRLGKHPYGYTSFYFDITEKLKYGGNNIIAVKVRNEGENSRWYSGSGIYRHVWLRKAPKTHIAPWGVSVTTPQISPASATVRIKTTVNEPGISPGSLLLKTRILDAEGKEQSSVSSSPKSQPTTQELQVKNPLLWSIDAPYLYILVSELYASGRLLERTETTFGIRGISFDATHGFRLNGKSVKLKGGCIHHDNGPLGAKAIDRAEERKIELLKAAGYNAIRTSHNPPSPALLDACDRLGMLVIDEAFDTWNEGKNPFDYNMFFEDWWQKDLESMVLRDRNHPSIIMWSTGNEIPHRERPEVAELSGKLAEFIRSIDSTRPVTSGVNGVAPDKDPLFATIDVAGYNYARDKYETDHQRVPDRVMYASESFPIEAYEYWKQVEAHPYVVGDFVWTAFDYIGEASIGWLGYMQTQAFYPWNLAYCGDIDICGWKRPQSFYRDALWKKNQLSIFVEPQKPSFDTNAHKVDWSIWHWEDVIASWNWPAEEGKVFTVKAYTSCQEVELFLNGKSLGRRTVKEDDKHRISWKVPYQEGTLKVIGYADGKKVEETDLHTAGNPVSIRLIPDRNSISADGTDLAYITAELVDAKGNRHPLAENKIRFEIKGDAKIIATGNANPKSTESYTAPERTTWQGRCLAIVQSGKEKGTVELIARMEGLPEARLKITLK